jgi:hypothetical protein
LYSDEQKRGASCITTHLQFYRFTECPFLDK